MLSFIQNSLGRSPKSEEKRTRQMTLDSMFARMQERNASKENLTPPSLTTDSSATERSSEPAEDDDTSGLPVNPFLINTATQGLSTKSKSSQLFNSTIGEAEVSDTPSTPVIAPENDSQETLITKGVNALKTDWELGDLPGAGIKLSPAKRTSPRGSKPVSRAIKDDVSSVVNKTKSVLGKRSRDTDEPDPTNTKKVPTKEPRRISSRFHQPLETPAQEPEKKKVRVSKVEDDEDITTAPVVKRKIVKKRTKHYMDHGVYVGQTRPANSRFAISQKETGEVKPRKENSIMPRPMFLGEQWLNRGEDFKLPFSVFSPLPPGQPRPHEWAKQQKNTLYGDAKQKWKKVKHSGDSKCFCDIEIGCNEDCLNRGMLYECDESNCVLWPEHCGNRAFGDLTKRKARANPALTTAADKYRIGVEVMVTEDRGHGLRANRSFEPGQIIVEYAGEIITQEESDNRMHNQYKDSESYYLMDFHQGMILDATKGSIARFVNHSCEPNCKMVKWLVRGEPRMALFAGDNGIMTGEELTYDYNFAPFSKKDAQPCFCGTASCRGTLDKKPKETKDVKVALAPITGVKRKASELLEKGVEKLTGRKTNKAKSVKEECTGAEGKEREPKKPQVKPLPKGWIYPKEPQEKKSINNQDPEAILKAKRIAKRKGLNEDDEDIKQERGNKKPRLASVKEEVGEEFEEEKAPRAKLNGVRAKTKSVTNRARNSMKNHRRSVPVFPNLPQAVEDIPEEEEEDKDEKS